MNLNSLETILARLKECGPIRLVCIPNARKCKGYCCVRIQGKQFWTKYVETFKEYVRKYGCVKDLIKKVVNPYQTFCFTLAAHVCSIVTL